MNVLGNLTMALWQSNDETISRDHHLVVIFIGMVAVALVVQATSVLIGLIGAMASLKKIHAIAVDMQEKSVPVLVKSHALLTDLAPKISAITTNVNEISYTVREKTDELGATLSQLNLTVAEVNMRTRVHVAHVDRIVDSALATTEEVKDVVAEGIRGPVRQIAGVIAGLRAGLETLVSKTGRF